MCNCLEETLDKVNEKIKERVPKKATEFKSDWKGKVFRFDGGCGVGLYIEWEYRNAKKDGTPYANKKKEESFIALTFCPFCGEKMGKPKNAKA